MGNQLGGSSNQKNFGKVYFRMRILSNHFVEWHETRSRHIEKNIKFGFDAEPINSQQNSHGNISMASFERYRTIAELLGIGMAYVLKCLRL